MTFKADPKSDREGEDLKIALMAATQRGFSVSAVIDELDHMGYGVEAVKERRPKGSAPEGAA